MTGYINKILSLLIALLFQTAYSFCQIQFDDDARASFVYDISKYITWENESAFPEFNIGILEKDCNSNLRTTLIKMAENKKILHNKPIRIMCFSAIDEISSIQVLYVNKLSGFDIEQIFERIKGKNILLATENYEFHKSMVNFIVVDGKKRFELNEAKMNEARLTASELFIGLAVKTKEDWEVLYKKTDVLLQKEKETVAKQTVVIDEQQAEIQQQNERIIRQREEIAQQQGEIERQKSELTNLANNIRAKQTEIVEKNNVLENQKASIKNQVEELKKKKTEINEKKKILEAKEEEIVTKQEKINIQNKTLNAQLKEIEKQQLVLYFFCVLLLLVTGLGYVIYRSYRMKKKANYLLELKNKEIMQQNQEIRQQKEEIEAQNDEIMQKNEILLQQKEEIESQRDKITVQRDEIKTHRDIVIKQKEEIMDSIHYASRIQKAILPPLAFIDAVMPAQYFILNKPRDIVSGDFFWVGKHDDNIVVLAADCTGHGVPGAFMSMLGVSFLNDIINKRGITVANKILDELREYVVRALHQTGKEGESKDGMDMALCVINDETNMLQFSGANNPLYLIQTVAMQPFELREILVPSIVEVKGDKMPVGIYPEGHTSFTLNQFQLHTGDTFYIFSDGYADQFGGPNGKKFKYKPFKQLLLSVQEKDMKEQKIIIEQTIVNWRGALDQVDDILVIGIRIS